jgi:hypothetical protein
VEAANAPVVLGPLADEIFGAVESVVDHDDCFPVQSRERAVESSEQGRDVVALAEAGTTTVSSGIGQF